MKENCPKNLWGGKRQDAGRKKTCLKKIPFNRRINEDVLNILKEYALLYGISETEALERAIILQSNIDKFKGEKNMKIAIPTLDDKLCAHFGHCESFTFVEVNADSKEIISIENKAPEEGISCQSSKWIAEQGANIVLAGGIGNKPLQTFEQLGVQVIAGCPEMEIEKIVNLYLSNSLATGTNNCSGEHHHCGGHHEHGHNHSHNHCNKNN